MKQKEHSDRKAKVKGSIAPSHKTLADTNNIYRKMAQLYQMGMDANGISSYLNVKIREVEKAMATDQFKNHVRMMQAHKQHNMHVFTERFDGLAEKALGRLEQYLGDDDLPPDIHLKVIEIIGDRHPSGLLAKQSKQEITHRSSPSYDSEAIEELKRRARSIDVTVSPVEEPQNGENHEGIRVETREDDRGDPDRRGPVGTDGRDEGD